MKVRNTNFQPVEHVVPSMALIQMHVQVVFCGTLILCMQQSAEDGTKKAQQSLYPKLHCKIEKNTDINELHEQQF